MVRQVLGPFRRNQIRTALRSLNDQCLAEKKYLRIEKHIG
jgi:hypothetical protein